MTLSETANHDALVLDAGEAAPQARTRVALDALEAALTPPAPEPVAEADVTACLDLVRSVAAQVREMHRRAHAVTQDAHQLVQKSAAAARAAEERADVAEAAARAAAERAERAEAQARALAARVRELDERAERAEGEAGRAQGWLRRVQDCIADEFDSLTVGPLPAPRPRIAA